MTCQNPDALIGQIETQALAGWLLNEMTAEARESKRERHAVKAAADWRCERCRRQCYRPEESVMDRRRVLTATRPEADLKRPLVAWCCGCQLRQNGPAYQRLKRRYRWERRRDHGQLPLPHVQTGGQGNA